MAHEILQAIAAVAWQEDQHGVITRERLLALGQTPDAIKHSLRTGRLFALWAGVYAEGRPQVSRLGRWEAATLACGPHSAGMRSGLGRVSGSAGSRGSRIT